MQWALILYGLCKSRQNAISSVIYLQIFITVIYLQMLFFCMLFFCRFFCYFCYFFLYVIFLHVIFLQYNRILIWTVIFWEAITDKNGWIEWIVIVVLDRWDLEIYVNVRQISLTWTVSEIRYFFCLEPLYFLVYLSIQQSRMYWKEIIKSLICLEWEKSTLHFHKFPNLSFSGQT